MWESSSSHLLKRGGGNSPSLRRLREGSPCNRRNVPPSSVPTRATPASRDDAHPHHHPSRQPTPHQRVVLPVQRLGSTRSPKRPLHLSGNRHPCCHAPEPGADGALRRATPPPPDSPARTLRPSRKKTDTRPSWVCGPGAGAGDFPRRGATSTRAYQHFQIRQNGPEAIWLWEDTKLLVLPPFANCQTTSGRPPAQDSTSEG